MLALTKRQVSKRRRSDIPIREGMIRFEDTSTAGLGRPRKRSVGEADAESQVALREPKRRVATEVENLSFRMQERLFGAAGPADGMEDMAWEDAK